MLPHPSPKEQIKQLIRLYESATPEQMARGHRWYRDANDLAHRLAGVSGYSLDQTAAVIAVLSPRLRWPDNVLAAGAAVAGSPRPVGIMKPNWDKAVRILEGDMSALSGPKVTAFWDSIMGNPHSVTIDSWAARAAISCVQRTKDCTEDDVGRYIFKYRIELISVYLDAAAQTGVKPADFQAVVWVVVKDNPKLMGTAS